MSASSPRAGVAGSANVAGHPSISWSIVLDARPTAPVSPNEIQARLSTAWPGDGRAGPPPTVAEGEAGEHLERLVDAANQPFVEGGPLCRVIVLDDPAGGPGRILVAGHHAVLDGMGLLAVLGAALSRPFATTARGGDGSAVRPARARDVARRILEAALAPPTRVAPDVDGRSASGEGDHLVRCTVRGAISSAALAAASGAAVRAWNRSRGSAADRIVVAIGASATSGAPLSIGRRAMWFRVRLGTGGPDQVREAMRARGPEPRESASLMRVARASGVSTLLERRTGSTLLVSHLGGIDPHGGVSELAFFPSAHGRSGVAVGGASIGDRTIVTVRARRRDFGDASAQELADLVGAVLEGRPISSRFYPTPGQRLPDGRP